MERWSDGSMDGQTVFHASWKASSDSVAQRPLAAPPTGECGRWGRGPHPFLHFFYNLVDFIVFADGLSVHCYTFVKLMSTCSTVRLIAPSRYLSVVSKSEHPGTALWRIIDAAGRQGNQPRCSQRPPLARRLEQNREAIAGLPVNRIATAIIRCRMRG
jgi:hypothetical protein